MLVNAGNAIRVLSELDQNPKIAIYESPIPHEDIEGYQKIRQQIRNPLAIHFGGAPSFSTTLESQMCDGFVVHNGVSDILSKGALAAAFNKPFWLQMVGPGLMIALSAHLGSVLTHAQWPAISCLNIYADDLIVAPHTIAGGYIKVPDAPGLGVEFDESAIAKYRMEPPYELPEPAPDSLSQVRLRAQRPPDGDLEGLGGVPERAPAGPGTGGAHGGDLRRWHPGMGRSLQSRFQIRRLRSDTALSLLER